MNTHLRILLTVFMILSAALREGRSQQTIVVGAKHFTEGYILSELAAQLLESKGFVVKRQYNLGGTMVCFEALRKGEIDIYPEYTGTIGSEILKANTSLSLPQIQERVADQYELGISEPLGFNNTYALVIPAKLAVEKQIRTITDLQRHPYLKAGISYEFLKRNDGWKNLAQTYQLPQKPVALEHGLAYQAMNENQIDFTDAYSTDGEIKANNLIVLRDDKSFFPRYEAVYFYKDELSSLLKPVLAVLEKRIDEDKMQAMNAEVLYNGKTFQQVAADFLLKEGIIANEQDATSQTADIWKKTSRHLLLTFGAVVLAVLVALPLAIGLNRQPVAANAVLYVAGLLQTIPSIALLAIMIPLLGIGILPATVALFLYALLPILRNTLVGLRTVDPLLKKVADGMGLPPVARLRWVELPLAMPSILAGIRTAAVISVGTATLAAFIGAGGLGEYIVAGLALNNTRMILQGALPAAALAILIEWGFEGIERLLIPRHLLNRNGER